MTQPGSPDVGNIADQAWLRLTARAAMLVFSIIGSVGVPMLVSYFGQISTSIEATRDALVALREEVRVGRAASDARLAHLERRVDRLEAAVSGPRAP